MLGRDPDEEGRAATPLELLYDLTFVVAFGIAGQQMAHMLAEGHVVMAIVAFCFTIFAICWAWINFSWFSSAFDTDDWGYRMAVFVQIVGVAVLAVGIPEVFASMDAGGVVDNRVLVAGYVIMRLGMVWLWLRVARQSPTHARSAYAFAVTLVVAQCAWLVLAWLDLGLQAFFLGALVPYAIELVGPVIAERFGGTPWHAHHIAERYSLLAIITLGEGAIGTVASLGSVVEAQGWELATGVVVVSGVALTFGLWWVYFTIPFGAMLEARPGSAFAFGYAHIAIFAALAGTGAGLHVVGYALEHHTELGAGSSAAAVAVPVGVFLTVILGLYSAIVRRVDSLHLGLWGIALALLAAGVGVAATSGALPVSLLVIALAPAAVVIGIEMSGHRGIRVDLLVEETIEP